MVSAVVQDDGYEVSVTVSFVAAGRGQQVGDGAGAAGSRPGSAPAGRTETLSSVIEQSSHSSRKQGSDASAGLKPHKPNLMPKPPVKDSQLLKELGPGRGQISVIQQLLDQVPVNSQSAACSGSPDLLYTDHCLFIPPQGGRLLLRQRRTTRPVVAVLQGQCEAEERCRSDAVRCGGELWLYHMVSLLAAQTGLDLLGKLGKPKLTWTWSEPLIPSEKPVLGLCFIWSRSETDIT
ncbi:hypothetical protein INR49_008129 [Caranx melampygus]|nr:hypothetical protein INR49_008129 [Caranx melampygus]